MNRDELRQAVTARFPFDDEGFFYSSSEGMVLIHVSDYGRVTQLTTLNQIPIEDTEGIFDACVIMGAEGSNEIVHIGEPGAYHDNVFFSDHERLYTLDELDVNELAEQIDMSPDEFVALSKDQRIEHMPFVSSRLATSLQSFFDQLREVTPDAARELAKAQRPDPTAPTPARRRVRAQRSRS